MKNKTNARKLKIKTNIKAGGWVGSIGVDGKINWIWHDKPIVAK